MELKSRMPSALLKEQQPDEVNTESESDDIKWETEISFEDAYKALEEKLYGFKKVRPVLYLLWCYKTYLLHSKKVLLSSSLYAPVIPGWLVLQRLQSCYRPLETGYHFASKKSILQVMKLNSG